MKLQLIILSFFCITINSFAQKHTLKAFNLPDNTTMFVTATMMYNGETKQLTPQKQAKYDFINGLLTLESTMTIIGTFKVAQQKVYTYNTTNELVNITNSGGTADGSASHLDEKITYKREGEKLTVLKNGLLYKVKYFNKEGILVEEHNYDSQSNYIFNKIVYADFKTVTKQFNRKQEVVSETTEYFDKNDKSILSIMFNGSYPTYDTVTETTYDSNGNTEKMITNRYLISKLKQNFDYFKDGKLNSIPEDALMGKTETVIFYNYSENKLSGAQISSKQASSNDIEVNITALQTSDGKTYNINNQANFMAFLDATYQKNKASKQ